MKALLALALLLCAAPAFAASTASKVTRAYLGGKEYVRLDDWARANAFQWKWAGKEAQLAKGATRMVFTADSRRMEFNGITIWLSEAVRNDRGVPWLSSLDLTTAVQPLLFPPKNRPGSKVRHVCIDAGHGGKDPGNREGSRQEKVYTLLLAQELGAQLRQAGYTVSYTRSSDIFLDLPQRPDLARRKQADLFISLHFNAAPTASTSGVEVFCMTPARASSTNARGEGATTSSYAGNANNSRNMLLAYELQRAMVRGTNTEDRGVKRARFAVLKSAQMPAVLVEAGFMSNAREARNIYSPAWRKQMATAIVNGIQSYRRAVEG